MVFAMSQPGHEPTAHFMKTNMLVIMQSLHGHRNRHGNVDLAVMHTYLWEKITHCSVVYKTMCRMEIVLFNGKYMSMKWECFRNYSLKRWLANRTNQNWSEIYYWCTVIFYYCVCCIFVCSIPCQFNRPPSILKIQHQLTMKKSYLKYSLKCSIPGIYFIHMPSICIVLLCKNNPIILSLTNQF